MKKIIIILLIGASLFYFKTELFSFSSNGAFDKDGKPQAWIFTFNECGKPCNEAIATLKQRVDYTEFNVSEEAGKQRLNEIGGGNRFPLIIIGKRHLEGKNRMHIISALAEGIGVSTLTAYEQRVMEGHFYDDGTPAIVMYGASWCGYCKKTREYFNKNDIQFTELDAENSAKSEYASLRGTGFPLIYIGYRRIEGANIKLIEKTMNELNI